MDAALVLSLDDQLLIQFEISRVELALRNSPSEYERFVLQSQLNDYRERLFGGDQFEQKRREFFGEDYR
jgi:hypothetical protein